MIKQTIEFEDFDGNTVSEEHYFHLSSSQLMDWIAEKGEDLGTQMEETVKSGNAGEIMKLFREIIEKSYGKRESGSQFIRSPEITAAFMNSMAFESFFGDLLTNDGMAEKWFNGIMPQKLIKQLEAKVAARGDGAAQTDSAEAVENEAEEDKRSGLKRPRDSDGKLLPWAHRAPSQAEMRKMNKDQMQDVYNRMNAGWKPTVSSV